MQNNTPKRPTISRQAVLIAARQTAASVINTTSHCNLDLNHLSETIVRHWRNGMDAYELAKKLEAYSRYRPDMEMLNALEKMNRNVDILYRDQLENWINTQDIKPPFPIGTEIKEGIIKRVDPYGIARYMIRVRDCKEPSSYLLKNFEDAVWVSAPEAKFLQSNSIKCLNA